MKPERRTRPVLSVTIEAGVMKALEGLPLDFPTKSAKTNYVLRRGLASILDEVRHD